MKILSITVGGILLSACGSMRMTSSSDAAAYDNLAVDASQAIGSYRDATAAMSSPEQCRAAVDVYGARMQDMIERMKAMAGLMDDHMKSMGHSGDADVQCGIQLMAQELVDHRAAACAMSDMAGNRAEAARHSAAMEGYTEHMRMRAAQLMSTAHHSGGMMGSGGTGTDMDGGWHMPDGGMMGWDHAMPGCTSSG